MNEDISTCDDGVSSTPKRRSLYDTIKYSIPEAPRNNIEYKEKCKLEIETHENILQSTREIIRKLKADKSKKTIVADVNLLDPTQRNFLKKTSNYLELVEDFLDHLAIEVAIARKFHNMCSHCNKLLKQSHQI